MIGQKNDRQKNDRQKNDRQKNGRQKNVAAYRLGINHETQVLPMRSTMSAVNPVNAVIEVNAVQTQSIRSRRPTPA